MPPCSTRNGSRAAENGRTTALPSGGGTATLGYYSNDLVAEQVVGDRRQTWALDPGHRFRSYATYSKDTAGQWTQAAGTDTTKTNHYGEDTDNPDWVDEGNGTITRNTSGLTGDLTALTSPTGDVRLQVTNLHGDVTQELQISDLTKPDLVHDADEYGNPRATSPRYGWLGAKQRSTDTLNGLTLMGVRLYNPATGRFLSIDPEPGGNPNAYTYPLDPVNMVDLDGRIGFIAAAVAIGARVGVRACIRFCVRGARAANHAAKARYAKRLSRLYNGNRTRVSIERRRGRTHYDLHAVRGRGSHYSKALRRDVRVPHKTWQPRNHRSPHGWGKSQMHNARPMTWWDMARVRRHIRR